MEHLGQDDVAVEKARAVLVGEAELLSEALRGDEKDGFALAFEQGVRGDRGAHLDAGDAGRGDAVVRAKAEEFADAVQRGVSVAFGVFRQVLGAVESPVRLARDDVGERAAAVDPEIPGGHAHPLAALDSRAGRTLWFFVPGRREKTLSAIRHARPDDARAIADLWNAMIEGEPRHVQFGAEVRGGGLGADRGAAGRFFRGGGGAGRGVRDVLAVPRRRGLRADDGAYIGAGGGGAWARLGADADGRRCWMPPASAARM